MENLDLSKLNPEELSELLYKVAAEFKNREEGNEEPEDSFVLLQSKKEDIIGVIFGEETNVMNMIASFFIQNEVLYNLFSEILNDVTTLKQNMDKGISDTAKNISGKKGN